MNRTENEAEKWIRSVLASIDGIQPAQGSPFLYQRILVKLSAPASNLVPVRMVWLSVVGMTLLVALNLATLRKLAVSDVDAISVVVSEYHLDMPDAGILTTTRP